MITCIFNGCGNRGKVLTNEIDFVTPKTSKEPHAALFLLVAHYIRTMIPALTIAAATQQDIPALHQLINSAYRGDSSRAGWTTEADLLGGIRITTEGLQETFEKPGATILKAENEDGELIGCVYLEQLPDALYLGMLTVNPQLQNSGIGKKLLFAGEDLAHEKKLPKMRMSVISARDTLIAWYQRHGYQPTGAKQPFPNNPKFGEPKQPLEFIVLEKVLNHL